MHSAVGILLFFFHATTSKSTSYVILDAVVCNVDHFIILNVVILLLF